MEIKVNTTDTGVVVVPEGKLTVARARHTTIEGWTRPVKKTDGGK